ITDVGHLTADGDQGVDKIELGARREQTTASQIIERYTKAFKEDLVSLGIATDNILFPRATQHIEEQVALIKTLEEKGYAYRITDGIYFDTAKFKNYGALGQIKLDGLEEGVRVEANPLKHGPYDFALWKFTKPNERRQQEWESPWGRGFPGWHIECSAMSMKYLGRHFDIHTGGIDHIPTHHNNEIAQSESATGEPFVNYWLHHGWVHISGEKISKSVGNTITLAELAKKGFSAFSYKYWILTAHHRTPVNFTLEALEGAETALFKLHRYVRERLGGEGGTPNKKYVADFRKFIEDDLDSPRAIALLWEMLKDPSIKEADKKATIMEFDKVLDLGFHRPNEILNEMIFRKIPITEFPHRIQELVYERDAARLKKDWGLADKIREQLEKLGYEVKDSPEGTEVSESPRI
ncbi:MAG: class I tRNA ligase family protein, partial [bacterium]|nr:class I tRNA ligase family protein [bacterium]